MNIFVILGLAILLSAPIAKAYVSKLIMDAKQVDGEKRIAAVLKLWER